ncbi:hypothetical protein E2C01_040376 [Portunus trituberculatus]|uniref:Uncharacterized protein n=1 Tax=Portunus trituberculatus TaxID=210409 RepID=A0A5B7FJJ5_PORTR|nr:hypothetical protein [Portunus trituberculatus]
MPGAPGTSGSVYGGGVGDSHWSTMPGSRPITQEMEVGVWYTAPMPGSQTPFQDVEVGVCHTASMPGGQLTWIRRKRDHSMYFGGGVWYYYV